MGKQLQLQQLLLLPVQTPKSNTTLNTRLLRMRIRFTSLRMKHVMGTSSKAPIPLWIPAVPWSLSTMKQGQWAIPRPERRSSGSLRSGPSPPGLLQLLLKQTRELLSKGSSPSCSHRLGRLSAVPFRLVERLLLLQRQKLLLPLLLKQLVLRPKGALLLKLLVLRLRGVLLLKLLLLLQLPLLLPVQTVLTSLGMEVTTLECRPLTSRPSIKSDRTSEECDILPTTTTDSMTLRRRPCLGSTLQLC